MSTDQREPGALRLYLRELRSVLRGNVGVIAISWFLFSISGSIVNPFFAKYAKDLGASDVDVALLRSLGMMALALSLIPGGILTDYIGRAKTIIIGTACVTFSQFLYAAAPDWRFLAGVYVFDMAAHFYQPALTAIIMDSLPRGAELKGFVALQIVSSTPGLFMPIIGGYLYDAIGVLGIRYGFLAQGFVALAVLIMRIKALQETYKPVSRDLSKYVFELSGYRPVLLKAFKFYVYTAFLWPIAASVLSTYGTIYAIEVIGLSKLEWGIVSCASTAGSIIVMLTLLGRRVEPERALVRAVAIASTSIVVFPIPYFTSCCRLLVLVAASVALSASSGVAMSAISATLTAILPPEIRGRATGIQRTLEQLGGALSSIIAAALYLGLGPGWSIVASGLVGFLGAAYVHRFIVGRAPLRAK